MRGLFVSGTDTGVGKSITAAAICTALAARGERVAAFKPAVTGLAEPVGCWPPDHELLAHAASAGQTPEEVAPARFDRPLSPHYAAELAGQALEPLVLATHARRAAARADALICEGVGGLLVPLTPGFLVRDLALELGLPLVIVARPGLGTINHTLLTLEAARRGGLETLGVVLSPWPAAPGDVERSNRQTLERIGDVAVVGLPRATPAELAEAGASLPLDAWLSPLNTS